MLRIGIAGTPVSTRLSVKTDCVGLIGITVLFGSLLCEGQGSLPIIKPGGVVSASAFGQFTTIAPGSWIEIYGSNLAGDSRSWTSSDFNGVNAPTELDGTRVSIGGQAAFIDYISPGQVNAQVPSGIASGAQSIVVTTASGPSSPYSLTVAATEPGLLAPSSFLIGGAQYVVALFPDGATYVLPPGAISGLPSARAQPGNVITLYGVGFGPVVPNTPAGEIVQQTNALALPFQVTIGGVSALTTYAGLAPSAVGLYQFNVVVPSVPGNDTTPLSFTLNGNPGVQTLNIAIENGTTVPQIKALAVTPASITGGSSGQGSITLSAPAPTGGVVVALSSNSSSASVPATVTVPAGSTLATFTVSTTSVTSNQSVTITASCNGSSMQASLSVTPASALPAFASITIYSSTLPSGIPGITYAELGIIRIDVTQLGASYISQLTGSILNSSEESTGGYLAVWNGVSISGQTLTFTNLSTTSTMTTMQGAAQITSGSLTIGLSPEGAGTSGTVTGSLSLVSNLATVSGSFTGTYAMTQ